MTRVKKIGRVTRFLVSASLATGCTKNQVSLSVFFICVHFWISMRVYVRAGDVLDIYSFVRIHTHEQAQMRVSEFIFIHH